MASGSKRVGLAARLYRHLLIVYPARFRHRHGEPMVQAFRDRLVDARRSGLGSLGIFWLETLRDVIGNGIAERVTVWRGNAGGERTSDEKRDWHTTKGGGGMESFVKDTRYALRMLRRSPGFALVAVLTIGLGIGATTAIFSVVEAVLLTPLPYPSPGELVIVPTDMENRDYRNFSTSPRTRLEYERQTTVFADFGGVFSFQQALTGEGDPVPVRTTQATWNIFDLLGVQPVLGRTFVPEDSAPIPGGGSADDAAADEQVITRSVMISHGAWNRYFGGDPAVVGRIVELGGHPSQVVGVLPAGFRIHMPSWSKVSPEPDFWRAIRVDETTANFANAAYHIVARLKPGVTVEQAQEEMDRLSITLRGMDGTLEAIGFRARVESLSGELTAHVRPLIVLLSVAVALVLLIACANVSNLLLVRATTREREMAVRTAMGGSRLRIVRQMFVESGVLAGLGGILGVVFGFGGIRLLLALQPEDLPRIEHVGIDGTVLAFTLVATGFAALLFSLVPVFQGVKVDVVDSLKDRGGGGTSRLLRTVRNGVVVSEVALSVALLIAAGLMVRSFRELRVVAPGYDAEGVLTFMSQLPDARYPTSAESLNFYAEAQRRIEGLPGSESASGAFPLPLADFEFAGRYGTEQALEDDAYWGQADYRFVLPGYFETMRTDVFEGRGFSAADEADGAAHVVVDRKLAELTWPGESAVGKALWIRVRGAVPERMEVIGVVDHQRHGGLAEESRETVYIPRGYVGFGTMWWAVRTSGNPLQLVDPIQAVLREIDPLIPMVDVRTMESYLRESMAPTRFALVLISVFAGVAIVLSAVGLYGVLAYLVRQRTREIGIRMAFGAPVRRIHRIVLGQGMALAGIGIAIGLASAVVLSRLMESLLVGVAPTDVLTFGTIPLIFIAVAFLATYLPAVRATRVDPIVALRDD